MKRRFPHALTGATILPYSNSHGRPWDTTYERSSGSLVLGVDFPSLLTPWCFRVLFCSLHDVFMLLLYPHLTVWLNYFICLPRRYPEPTHFGSQYQPSPTLYYVLYYTYSCFTISQSLTTFSRSVSRVVDGTRSTVGCRWGGWWPLRSTAAAPRRWARCVRFKLSTKRQKRITSRACRPRSGSITRLQNSGGPRAGEHHRSRTRVLVTRHSDHKVDSLGNIASVGKVAEPSEGGIQKTTSTASIKARGIRPDQLSLSSLSPETNAQCSIPCFALVPPASSILPSGESKTTPRVEREGGQGPTIP